MAYGEYYYPPTEEDLSADEKKAALDRIKAGLGPQVDAAEFDALMATPTAAIKDAQPADGPFPMLVFAQGFGQDPSSQNILSEYLASHGYVVATVPQIGRSVSDDRLAFDLADLLIQQRDLGFALAHLAGLDPRVDLNVLSPQPLPAL